jgi:DNA helicase HerA-like ATPase
MGSALPDQGPYFGRFSSITDFMKIRLLDNRYRFLIREYPSDDYQDPLSTICEGWLGESKPISILDFSGVPEVTADISIGVVLRTIFDMALASNQEHGIGKNRPVLIIIEEAHRFLSKSKNSDSRLVSHICEDIIKEGRKYGVGLMAISQRPSEINETLLSQFGTFISFRLTNPTDQGIVYSNIPDFNEAHSGILSSLRTGEALVTGEAIPIPTRVNFILPENRPDSKDPSILSWEGNGEANDLEIPLKTLRGENYNLGGEL